MMIEPFTARVHRPTQEQRIHQFDSGARAYVLPDHLGQKVEPVNGDTNAINIICHFLWW
jgi:hypothetical protein